MLAHDEYGIALAAFDHKKEALEEFAGCAVVEAAGVDGRDLGGECCGARGGELGAAILAEGTLG